MSFDENTPGQPFEIQAAREAQHAASKLQRDLSDALASAHKVLAAAEFRYHRALSERMKQLHTEGIPGGNDSMAITTCEVVAKGEEPIALLRQERDDAKGDLAKLEQEAYRLAADRRALDGLVDWSMRRDLRVDAEPADWSKQETHGSGEPRPRPVAA